MKLATFFLAVAAVASAQDFKQENKAENLKALFQKLTKAVRDRDDKTAVGLTQGLFLDETRLKKALKDDVGKDFLGKLVAMHAEFLKAEESKQASAFPPGDPKRTEVQVHPATTEEIAKYEAGGTAFKEFPGGAKRLAESVLRAGVTFYEVEIVEPGQDTGMKFHLFFWDGERWSMLGPAWRFLGK